MFLSAVAAALFTAGCSSVGVTKVSNATPKPETCNLDIYASDSDVGRPFKVVCIIDSRTGSTVFDKKTAAAAINNAKPKACECGADAIVISSADTEGATWARWGQGKAFLKAIRYEEQVAK
jgi:hypothetical protein